MKTIVIQTDMDNNICRYLQLSGGGYCIGTVIESHIILHNNKLPISEL